MFEKFEDHCRIDFTDCDSETKRKLILAMMIAASHEGDTLVKWSAVMIAEQHLAPRLAIYNMANSFIVRHKAMDESLSHHDLMANAGRFEWFSELMEWAGKCPRGFWRLIRDKIYIADRGILPARVIIKKGPP